MESRIAPRNSVPVADDDQDESSASSCGSVISSSHEEEQPLGDVLVKLAKEERAYEVIKIRFLAGLGVFGVNVRLEEIHRIMYTGAMREARFKSFYTFQQAVTTRCGGNANVKYCWYGASKSEIDSIILDGFGSGNSDASGYGIGVHLSSDSYPVDSVESAVPDKDGLRYLLLCRIILGKMESIPATSKQSRPSSREFDSGVDNLTSPKKYIVWNTKANSHILPEFIFSFRAPADLLGGIRTSSGKPISPWMPFPSLLAALSMFLPSHSIDMISKYHRDHKEKKITRIEMIRNMRRIAGDDLLTSVIKSYRHKKEETSSEVTSRRRSTKRQYDHMG